MRLRRLAAPALVVAWLVTFLAPSARASMPMGNYDLLTDRYTLSGWVWSVNPCAAADDVGCVAVAARPSKRFYDDYDGEAHLVDGWYAMTVDVPDGLRCPGYNLPTHETYSWDAAALTGTIDSHYEAGCFDGPPGAQRWTFALQRL